MSEANHAHKLLIFATDQTTAQEIRDAVKAVAPGALNVYQTTDLTQASDIVRDREPDAVLIELTGRIADDRSHISELRSLNPELCLVGVYSGEGTASGITSAYMVELVRCGVTDFLRRPIAAAELAGFFQRLTPSPIASEPSRHGVCIAFISNKGGVGKSTLAVNVATRWQSSIQMKCF